MYNHSSTIRHFCDQREYFARSLAHFNWHFKYAGELSSINALAQLIVWQLPKFYLKKFY